MLRILFSGPTLERSRIQPGLNAGHTGVEGSDWIKTTTGKEKNIAATRREKKKHDHIFTESIWSGPVKHHLGLWDGRQ